MNKAPKEANIGFPHYIITTEKAELNSDKFKASDDAGIKIWPQFSQIWPILGNKIRFIICEEAFKISD